jgi:hypothetical protein
MHIKITMGMVAVEKLEASVETLTKAIRVGLTPVVRTKLRRKRAAGPAW